MTLSMLIIAAIFALVQAFLVWLALRKQGAAYLLILLILLGGSLLARLLVIPLLMKADPSLRGLFTGVHQGPTSPAYWRILLANGVILYALQSFLLVIICRNIPVKKIGVSVFISLLVFAGILPFLSRF